MASRSQPCAEGTNSLPDTSAAPSAWFTTYEVVTQAGAAIKTFDNRKAATRHAAEIAHVFPGCAVFAVTVFAPKRERIYTPRRVAA